MSVPVVTRNTQEELTLALFFSATPTNMPAKVFSLFDTYYKNPTLLYIFHSFQAVPTKDVIFTEYSLLMERYKGERLSTIRKWKRKEKDLMFEVTRKIEEQRTEEQEKRDSGVDKLLPKDEKPDDNRPVIDSEESAHALVMSLLKKENKNAR